MKIPLLSGVAALSLLAACTTTDIATMETTSSTTTTPPGLPAIPQATGIFAQASTLPLQAPDFSRIRDEDYQPAIEQGIAIKLAEIAQIARNPESPTFENTLVAMERAGPQQNQQEIETVQKLNAEQAAFAARQIANNEASRRMVEQAIMDRNATIARQQAEQEAAQQAYEAESQRRVQEHDAAMARWRADVAACNAGDFSRCSAQR